MAKQPNIILINCDDLGYGDLGCYGSKVHSTPVLDEMARKGARFTDFYMASSVCSPSRGAMMTGCYPRRIGFGNFEGKHVLFPGQGVGLSQDEWTIAKALKQEGYSTMMIGKWHCGDQPEFLPTKHGFDHYFGLPYSNDMGRQVTREGRVREHPPLPLLLDDEVLQEQPDQRALTERYLDNAVRYIRDNRSNPFFLYLAHMHVHLPLYVSERFMQQSRNGAYGAAVECVDWVTGVILHELNRLGLSENTLIVFTSDNGSRCDNEGSNGELRGRKGTTYEGGMRLPCIMYWPGVIPDGTVCSEIATSMDFLPTFAALAGSKLPEDRIIDGKDIRPLMTGESGAETPHRAFFYYFKDTIDAVRAGKWKLHIRKRNEPVNELYDLEADVSESVNLYEQRPEIVDKLMQLVAEMREDLGDEAVGAAGTNCRPIGKVDNPAPLTSFDSNHPYFIATYDLTDAG
jgi:arylsulfatase A